MNIAINPKSSGNSIGTSLTNVSVLTLAGQKFGFPQGNNFGAILMSSGTESRRSGIIEGRNDEQFWFPTDRVFGGQKNEVKFRSTLHGYFFGLYGDKEKIEFTDKNPNLLTGYVFSLNEAVGKHEMGYEPPCNETGDRAIAAMLIPVIAGMPDDAAHAMKCNLMHAREWFFWPHGVSDSRLFGLASIYGERGNPDGPKDLWLPNWKGSPTRYLQLKYSDEYAGNRRGAKAEALSIAREFIQKAYEIYSRFVPKALESHYGETRWQLPQLTPGK